MFKKFFIFFICIFFAFSAWARDPVIIGSKNFSESFILGEIAALLLEEKWDQPVQRKFGLGGTKITFDALDTGSIHVYPDYTGTGYIMILGMDGERDPEKVYKIVNKEFKDRWNIEWSDSMGFSNAYALAVRNDDKRFKNIKDISELSGKVGKYKYASPHEFLERKDGYTNFTKKYKLNFNPDNVIAMESGLTYAAIRDKQVDMIVAYSTDGRIKAYNLRLINDDKRFFPPYYVSLLAKRDTLKKFPALKKVFQITKNLITEDQMIYMNDQVDRYKKEPIDVARDFLVTKGLLDVRAEVRGTGFFQFLIRKKRYLMKLLGEHLAMSFGALALALLVSIPVGVILTRHQSLGKIVFPIINIIQTIPSLALLGFLIPIMGIGFAPAIVALFLYSLLPLIRNTYTGILGVDKNYIEASRGMGLTSFQILFKVEMPLALPVILTGLRTAAVIVIGTTTLAALIGAGGLGDPIFRGVATLNSDLILLGAVPAAILSIIVDKLIGFAEKIFVSKGIVLMTRL